MLQSLNVMPVKKKKWKLNICESSVTLQANIMSIEAVQSRLCKDMRNFRYEP